MKRVLLLVSLLAAFTWTAFAGAVTVTFDDPSLAHESDVANFYAALPGGPTFGTDQAIILQSSHYNESAYPYKSSPNVVYSPSSGEIDLTWTTGTISDLSLWYVTYFDLTFTAYDNASNVISTATYTDNVNAGSNVSVAGSGIQRLVISGTANFYVLDDISYTSGVPEPGSMGLLGLGMIGIVGLFHRRVRA